MADQWRNQVLADAENHLKQACEMLQQEATRLRQKQEECDSISKKLTDDSSLIAELNVGGHHFTTSIQTLRKDPNSMLAAMFSGKFDIKRSKDGSFFIDRDGTHFRFILNYLRTGKLTLPEGATFLKELEQEAKFYQIQGILDELKPKPFGKSKILTNKEQQQILKGWLPTEMEGEWRLLFRASRDGFGSESFHSKCDKKGPTITIARSGEYIFGGFTEESWRRKVFHTVLLNIWLGGYSVNFWAGVCRWILKPFPYTRPNPAAFCSPYSRLDTRTPTLSHTWWVAIFLF